MQFIPILLFLTLLGYAGDWPQFKKTPDKYGCDLSETVILPSRLCLWADFGSPVIAPPAIVGDRVYAIASSGLLACIDLTDSRIVWTVRLGGRGNESTPSVMNGKVYVGTKDGLFQVLDAETGEVLNRYQAGGPIFSHPLLLESGVYFSSFDSTFHALDLDGNLKWKYVANVNMIHGACYYDSTLIFLDGDDKIFWAKESAGVGVVHYKQLPVGDPQAILTPPVVWRDTIYLARDFTELTNAGLWIYAFETGLELKRELGTSSQIRTAPSVDTSTGYLYSGSTNGGLFALQASTARWSTLPKTETHPPMGLYRVNSSPAVVSNCVIAGTEDAGLCFFNKGTGAELWSFEPPGVKPISSSPAVSHGRVLVGSTDGCLYGFWNGAEVIRPILVSEGTAAEKPLLAGGWMLHAFPNPSNGGLIHFRSDAWPRGARFSVFDATGRLVGRFAGASRSGDVVWNGRNLSAGTYVVRVQGVDGVQLKSFRLKVVR